MLNTKGRCRLLAVPVHTGSGGCGGVVFLHLDSISAGRSDALAAIPAARVTLRHDTRSFVPASR